MNILGIHFGHDSNAAIVIDGKIIAAVQEERFNRVKHSADIPLNSIDYCLKEAQLKVSDLDVIAISGQNIHKDFYRIFINKKEEIKSDIPVYINKFILNNKIKIQSFDHHMCHAACGYCCSYFDNDKVLIIVSDGAGDDCSISIWKGYNGKLTLLKKYPKTGSMGWFFSNVTEALGWVHGDGEGKTMGLASYGDFSNSLDKLKIFSPYYIDGQLVKERNYGDVGFLKLKGAYHWHFKDANLIYKLLIQEKIKREDLACAAQKILEDEHIKIIKYWIKVTGINRVVLSGGVFLNIVLNRKICDLEEIDKCYIFPNPGDSSLGLGASLCAMLVFSNNYKVDYTPYLGPSFSSKDIEFILQRNKIKYKKFSSLDCLCKKVAEELSKDKCVGWFQGRMEYGPRALGNRSILMSPLNPQNRDYINKFVKFREKFRPFCPSILYEEKDKWLKEKEDDFYMILCFNGKNIDKIPSVVHVDGTLRPQLVRKKDNPLYYRLIKEFKKITGIGVLLNTSLNIMGEPIVLSPTDAIKCFYSTGLDILVMENILIEKN